VNPTSEFEDSVRAVVRDLDDAGQPASSVVPAAMLRGRAIRRRRRGVAATGALLAGVAVAAVAVGALPIVVDRNNDRLAAPAQTTGPVVGVRPQDVPELTAFSRAGQAPPVPLDEPVDCQDRLAALPGPAFALPAVPDHLLPDPICLPENGLTYLYVPRDVPQDTDIKTMFARGAVLLRTVYEDTSVLPPLPGDDGAPAVRPEGGYANAVLAPGIGSRVFRVDDNWVNTLWYSRLNGRSVTGLLTVGQATPAQTATLAAQVLASTPESEPPTAAGRPRTSG